MLPFFKEIENMVKKKNKMKSFAMLFMIIGFISFIAWIIVGMNMRVSQNQINHYKDDGNYIEIECVIVEVTEQYARWGNDQDKAFQVIVGNEHDKRYDRIGLWKTNSSVIKTSNFWTDVNVGDTVFVFVTKGYFWDGYVRPIISIRTESKVYLDFEVGKSNQVKEMEDRRKEYLTISLPVIIISIVSVSCATGIFIVSAIKKRKTKV